VGFVLAGLAVFYQYQFSADLEEAQTRTEGLSAVLMPTVSDSAVIGDYDTIRRTLERAVAHSAFSRRPSSICAAASCVHPTMRRPTSCRPAGC
jgi:hypothetical protein